MVKWRLVTKTLPWVGYAMTLIYLYLLRLIRDLDDPFKSAHGYVPGATADVSPHPVLEYYERLKGNLAG
jgi:hypothetical protein